MIRVQRDDFDPAVELARLSAPGVGAVCSFVGLVRGTSDGRPMAAMTLEHYPGMAERELRRLEDEARARWPLLDALVVHRCGRLQPGERIVLVAVASPHRDAAFDACRFLIDRLKTAAPFWKSEETAKGSRWVEARAEDEAAAERWE